VNVGSLPELLIHEKTGWIVKEEDVRSLAEVIGFRSIIQSGQPDGPPADGHRRSSAWSAASMPTILFTKNWLARVLALGACDALYPKLAATKQER
jgi:hypothetical protein